jgi:hypothetical protein
VCFEEDGRQDLAAVLLEAHEHIFIHGIPPPRQPEQPGRDE